MKRKRENSKDTVKATESMVERGGHPAKKISKKENQKPLEYVRKGGRTKYGAMVK